MWSRGFPAQGRSESLFLGARACVRAVAEARLLDVLGDGDGDH